MTNRARVSGAILAGTVPCGRSRRPTAAAGPHVLHRAAGPIVIVTACITHEVRQPLSAIMTNASTFLRLLDADPPDLAAVRETAVRTLRDCDRAAAVLSRLQALFSSAELATHR